MTVAREDVGIVVLVVEDEPLIRMSAVDFVEDAGFTAIEAANADEAVGLIERGADVGIIFTDIDMPGSMNGLELARTVRSRWPSIGIIVASGHRNVADHELPERGRFFSKPYEGGKVAETMLAMAVDRKREIE